MNAFYSIADKQNFMTFVRLGTISIFLQNRVDERKTSKRAAVSVSVTCEQRGAASSLLPVPALLAARGIVGRCQVRTRTSSFFPGGRSEQARFGQSHDHGHYDVTAKKCANAQNFRKWRRRLSPKQNFKADVSNHSSFKRCCIWISRSNYHCSLLRGK